MWMPFGAILRWRDLTDGDIVRTPDQCNFWIRSHLFQFIQANIYRRNQNAAHLDAIISDIGRIKSLAVEYWLNATCQSTESSQRKLTIQLRGALHALTFLYDMAQYFPRSTCAGCIHWTAACLIPQEVANSK